MSDEVKLGSGINSIGTVGLNAGFNSIGKVEISQTTPGTTNGVQLTGVGTSSFQPVYVQVDQGTMKLLMDINDKLDQLLQK